MVPLVTSKPQTPHARKQDARSSSPSYFGLAVESGKNTVHSSSLRGVKGTFSPTSANIRSVAATPPQGLSLHSNSDYEAFRQQANQSSFSLSSGSVSQFSVPQLNRNNSRPSVGRTNSRQTVTSPKPRPAPVALQKPDTPGLEDITRPSRSPKRLLSSESQVMFDRPRRDSPVPFDSGESTDGGSPPARHDDKHPRLSLPPKDNYNPPSLAPHRAETLPSKFDDGAPCLTSSQSIVDVLDKHEEDVLILDLRVSTQYARAHIAGSLNLCVPTTLLKRASYNVQRLAETFKDEEQRTKFEQWASAKCIVVYDVNSTQMREAANCTNILKKFYNEGWQGKSYIIRGGFNDFSRRFPAMVEQGTGIGLNSAAPNLTLKVNDPNLPPVIGGCPIPLTKNAANPFFGNIRQNMDLIGGVGQMSIKHPQSMKDQQIYQLPTWLRKASEESDNGKSVSDKFLQIEKREQKRMQEALSGNVVYGNPGPDAAKKVQIAGIEKGAKNRYNNIWPYEHSRVKLENIPINGCDYVNANFIQTSLSRKRYIATQGPIPATFTDFWNMVWQRDIRVIVMLTAESEGGQIKAHNYWSDRHYGSLKLQFLSEHRASLEISKIKRHRKRPSLGTRLSQTDSKFRFSSSNAEEVGSANTAAGASDPPFVMVRRFTLSHEGQPFERMREITQLHYSSWPDFGAPAHPAHLLGLVEQCDAIVRSTHNMSSTGPSFSGKPEQYDQGQEERPVLVHCSAGCGRTGTFCAVDSVVDMLKEQRAAPRRASPMGMDNGAARSSKTDDVIAADNPFFGQSAEPGPVLENNVDDWLERDDMDLIERTVEEFRLQRLSMVQSLRQFVLCYETVLEWVVSQQESDHDAMDQT